jgi:hypothetical protein
MDKEVRSFLIPSAAAKHYKLFFNQKGARRKADESSS